MEQKSNKGNTGYMTVEAVLIVTVMLFAVLVIMYSFMLIYQAAVVQHAATVAARKGAEMVYGSQDVSVYAFYVKPTASDIEEIKEIAKKELKKGILSISNCEISAEKVGLDFLWSSGIEVTIYQEAKVPILGILNDFGITDVGTFESTAISEISSPQETIRNVDLGMDVVKQGISLVKDTITNLIKMFVLA